MPYDPELDELLEDLGPIDGTPMHAELRSYDGGPPRLNVFRMVPRKTKDDVRVKVFRLSLKNSHLLADFIKTHVSEDG